MQNSFGLEFDDLGGISDVVFFAIGMALVATLLWVAYRTMEHPRLPVIRPEQSAPTTTWQGVVWYLITTPFMVFFWQLVLLGLLTMVAGERTPVDMVVATCAVVGGARLLAHIKPDIAHELAKSVPVAILGFLIIGTGFVGLDRWAQATTEVPLDLLDDYFVGLVVWDVVLTTLWFVAIRLRWHHRSRRTAAGKPADGPLRQTIHRLRDIVYGGAQT